MIPRIALLALAFILPANAEKIRLKDSEGNSVDVFVISMVDENTAILRRANDDEEFETPLDLFSPESQKKVRAFWKEQQSISDNEVAPINETIGHRLLTAGIPLFDQPAADVAKRLRVREESKTDYTSSYRSYTGESVRFLGARPFSIALYGRADGKLDSISIVYANKGDSLSNAGFGEDHFDEDEEVSKKAKRKFAKIMQTDADAISTALTEHLGEGTKQRFGEKTDRRNVTRWDWRGHSFLLTHLADEYVGLLVTPTAFADRGGRSETLNDKELKARLTKYVQRRDNGDVFLDHIPMVDQGPKGYCAPATFERAMRYAGVPADMYLLATLATEAGGGTNTARLFEEVTSICRSKGRRAREFELGKIKMRDIKKMIDQGTPIMWSMRSLGAYNNIANRRTVERKSVTDWAAWKKQIKDEAQDNVSKLGFEDNHHLCMIIGYNENTDELAVSDSWGKRYTIRWVHIEEAEAVTSGSGYVIRR